MPPLRSDEFLVLVTGSAKLKVSEIWPDGDAPERPSATDVARVMTELYRSAADLIVDWNLGDDLDVEVFGTGSYREAFLSCRIATPASTQAVS